MSSKCSLSERRKRIPRLITRRRILGIAAILWLILGLTSVILAGRLTERSHPAAHVNLIGPEEIVFDWSEDACAPEDIPDAPVRAFRDAQNRVQLISSHYLVRRSIGPTLHQVTRDCGIVLASDFDPNPDAYNDREWLHAVYTWDGRTVIGLVHNEYHGQRHPGRCPSGEYRNCWYNAVTLATSTDGGDSYQQADPPSHLVASIPYPYVPDSGTTGIIKPSNIVFNPRDEYYYSLLHVEAYGVQPWGTCVVRTKDLADPNSWRAWDGHAFATRFINPYLEPAAEPRDHVCQPLSRDHIQKMSESLTFNTYLDRFLLVGTAVKNDPTTGAPRWGVYYSLSEDLIEWTPRELIMEAELTWTFTCGDANPILYPSVLDAESPSRSFETTGQRVHMYYTRFNYTSCRMTLDRDLIRVPLEFSR